jgi:hypothetical protein
VICVLLTSVPLFGQYWSPGSGGTIYYNGGSVGIGISNPSAPLSLGYYAGIRQLVYDGPNATYNTGFGVDLAPGQGGLDIFMGQGNGSDNAVRIVRGNGAWPFSSYSALVTFNQAGSVGIGTTNPQHLLHVAGTIGAEEVLVTSTGADYVFQPGYRLRPLSEVAKYIEANRHLPDIPSADEVKQKGMGVGEMESKLLAKIEELTLHMIQADERNNRLEKQNQDLRDRIVRLEAQPAR